MYGPTTELPAAVIDEIARVAADEVSRVAGLIPAGPAAVLGRTAQPEPDRLGRRGPGHAPAPQWAGQAGQTRSVAAPNASAARTGLDEVPPLIAERLLGALELTVAALELPVPGFVEALPEKPARTGARHLAIATRGGDGETVVELTMLEAFAPGATDMVAAVVAALVAHPAIVPLLAGESENESASGSESEDAIAASHGARHLALSVVAATIVLRVLWPAVKPAAIIGTALGVAMPILRAAPMPPGYAEARLAKRRSEYLMPRHGNVQAVITDHVLALTEGRLTEGPQAGPVDFSENGLVAVVPNGIAIRSGQESGPVSVGLSVVHEPPEVDTTVWEEIVETSWHASQGGASFSGAGQTTQITPPWPGDYRVRVHVMGRDQGREAFHVAVWKAPAAETVVHHRSDRLGYELRGEPVPVHALVSAPDEVYHWIESSSLAEAATVTFVAGKSSSEVLRDFGADESAPTPVEDFYDRDYRNIDPWICVLDVPGGTVAVEFNGFQGSHTAVLRALSSPANAAASMYWNVNAHRRFSLARNGKVLADFEPDLEDDTSAEAEEALSGLDLKSHHRNAIGLLGAERFTGISLSAEDLAGIEEVGIGYPILPLLPDHHPEQRLPDGTRRWPGHGPLGADTDLLAAMPEERLRDLAWWAASYVVEHSELADDPTVTATLVARALTPEAEILARRSELHDHLKHRWLWLTLHAATNPDALGAAIQTLDKSRYAAGGHAVELLEQARARVTTRAD